MAVCWCASQWIFRTMFHQQQQGHWKVHWKRCSEPCRASSIMQSEHLLFYSTWRYCVTLPSCVRKMLAFICLADLGSASQDVANFQRCRRHRGYWKYLWIECHKTTAWCDSIERFEEVHLVLYFITLIHSAHMCPLQQDAIWIGKYDSAHKYPCTGFKGWNSDLAWRTLENPCKTKLHVQDVLAVDKKARWNWRGGHHGSSWIPRMGCLLQCENMWK